MLILISSLFQNAEAEVLLSIGKISLYKVGFIRGCRMSSVILTLAGGLLLFTATTQVQDLMAVLGKMCLSSNVVYMVVASFRSINELSENKGQILATHSSRRNETESYTIGKSTFNYTTNEIRTGNNKVLITSRHAEILRILAKNLHVPVDREILLKHVWGASSYANSLALNVQITYLRKALRNDSSVKIESLMKKGYVLHIEKG